MPFFQNPFTEEFEGNWLLGDRQYTPKFVIKGNAGRGQQFVTSWAQGPYDLSGSDSDGDSSAILNIAFSLYNTKNWATLSVDVTTEAASSSAVTSAEIAAALNGNTIFSERFIASVESYENNAVPAVKIFQKKPITDFKFYIIKGQAEEVICFNKRAGVAELPNYFSRHTIDNRFTFTDSQGMLVQLDPGTYNVDAAIIDNAVDARGVAKGYDSGTVHEDWELIAGKSGIFNFQKITVDGSDRITEIIEYPAGASVGDMARLTTYTYSGANKNPSEVTEVPYTLTSGDLITP